MSLQAVKDSLLKTHQFKLTGDDPKKIEFVLNGFLRGGPRMDYNSAGATAATNRCLRLVHSLRSENDHVAPHE